ncbi:uncharacterized protein LOC129922337 isoform X1 [Biomphalaria glabrata]|uniref:Uncharacterized protein LOC129922337 isoform X1 n=1 Tax=Biomphalaria glabrata TaxID=6526 RepID=A0A9W2YMB2_BIOGL|nr:uncharacterized protein LOC129922337 isoform X1 [Biomphalaria glabrata]XP_055863957.1 uncharacterized protein LOC129922337 isoform X1 [Biomphalaria glabrata]XP_055863958.1 uncharacterized protein LOC129922337 isoform X1 [Biomphalaria glabrata]XP_055863959.1 uncharacterized protein LOC129922337 isoform X1 [Biomphalaria glabrata]XP_055863960.1 uncharacterized protein LOC129922337 isoform X1 [Biomphalaria glabrata]
MYTFNQSMAWWWIIFTLGAASMETCPEGTFTVPSDDFCQPCTVCSELGQYETQPCEPENDAICCPMASMILAKQDDAQGQCEHESSQKGFCCYLLSQVTNSAVLDTTHATVDPDVVENTVTTKTTETIRTTEKSTTSSSFWSTVLKILYVLAPFALIGLSYWIVHISSAGNN